MDVVLTELQRIPTSGARAVESFAVGGRELLAIPQLAVDVPGAGAGMNVGDSDTDLLLLPPRGRALRRRSRTLPAPGGEDAEFFTIGERAFLAVAASAPARARTRYATDVDDLRVARGRLRALPADPDVRRQAVEALADRRPALPRARPGRRLPRPRGRNRPSIVFEWDGERFVEFQAIPSRWAYNWHPFEVDGRFFVAHADHLGPSVLYRWDGSRLVAHQELLPRAGRAFATFRRDGTTWSSPDWPSRRGAALGRRALRGRCRSWRASARASSRGRARRAPVPDPGQLHPRHARPTRSRR